MENLNEIRHHLKSVQQTRQITNAMYLLSTSRMKKAIGTMEYAKEYYTRVRATIKDILEKTGDFHSSYLEPRSGGKAAYLIIAGDKGMCGAYNSNVLKLAWEHLGTHPGWMSSEKQSEAHPDHFIATAGIMATEFFKRKGIQPDIELLGIVQKPTLERVREIMRDLLRLYEEGVMDEVYVVYTSFISSVKQVPKLIRLLPLRTEDFLDVELEFEYKAEMIYHPSEEQVLEIMVPQYMVGLMYNAFMHSYASEHSARLMAMQNATKNADEMIKKLSSQYNSARQYSITQEITEIVAGASWKD